MRIIETADAPSHTVLPPQAVEAGGWIDVSALFGPDPVTHVIPPDARAEAEAPVRQPRRDPRRRGRGSDRRCAGGICVRGPAARPSGVQPGVGQQFVEHRRARSAIEASDFGRSGVNARFMVEATAYRG